MERGGRYSVRRRESGYCNTRMAEEAAMERRLGSGSANSTMLLWTDPPDHTGPRDLYQWTVTGHLELCVRIGLAEVAYRAVVDHPSGTIRAKFHVGRTVEAADPA